MSSEERFTQRLWRAIGPIYAEIERHPFLVGLTDGRLPLDAFRFYVVQDAHYLREFARALSLAAARAPEDDWIITFNMHAADALRVERSLHEGFFRDLGLPEQEVDATPMAPTNLAYSSYLLSVAYGAPFPELVSTVLPCYWLYWEVGKMLMEHGSPNPLYRRWIETYGADEFGAVVQAVLEIADRVAVGLPAPMLDAMERHFVTTSRYEWMFWEMGYRQERWPV